jgi:hypothetical protein
MGKAIGGSLPLAVGIALSPISIIAVARKILVGMSRTARRLRPEAERPPGAPRYGGTTR